MKDKVLVIGHARHGKDSFCEMLKDRGLSFESSSEAALDNAIWPLIKGFYKDKAQCFKDRVNHRTLWFVLITYFNTPDKSLLAKTILSESDIYCGLRNREEFEASKHLFKYIVWVDACDRLEKESEDSFQLTKDDANYFVDNNLDEANLYTEARRFMQIYDTNLKGSE